LTEVLPHLLLEIFNIPVVFECDISLICVNIVFPRVPWNIVPEITGNFDNNASAPMDIFNIMWVPNIGNDEAHVWFGGCVNGMEQLLAKEFDPMLMHNKIAQALHT
jgi:hypothetical protein